MLPCGSGGKESASNDTDPVSIPGLGRTPGEFLPGEFHGQRSLVGPCLWGCKELGTTGSNSAPKSLAYLSSVRRLKILLSFPQHSLNPRNKLLQGAIFTVYSLLVY